MGTTTDVPDLFVGACGCCLLCSAADSDVDSDVTLGRCYLMPMETRLPSSKSKAQVLWTRQRNANWSALCALWRVAPSKTGHSSELLMS